MADRSLTFFLGFLVLWSFYILYETKVEENRLFNIALQQEQVIKDCQKAMQSQALYIKLLETKLRNAYNPLEDSRQPLIYPPL